MFGRNKKVNLDAAVDLPTAPAAKTSSVIRRSTLVIYRAKDGWRWRLWAPNGKITADSGEAYKRRFECRAAANRLTVSAAHARIVMVEPPETRSNG